MVVHQSAREVRAWFEGGRVTKRQSGRSFFNAIICFSNSVYEGALAGADDDDDDDDELAATGAAGPSMACMSFARNSPGLAEVVTMASEPAAYWATVGCSAEDEEEGR